MSGCVLGYSSNVVVGLVWVMANLTGYVLGYSSNVVVGTCVGYGFVRVCVRV